MKAITRTIFWVTLLELAFCGNFVPGREMNAIDSEANSLESWNFATDLERMEAVDSNLSVEVARTIRNLSSYILSVASELLNAIDDVLFCVRLAQGQLAQLRAEAPQGYGGEVEELLRAADADLDRAVEILKANFIFSPNFFKDFSFSRTQARGEDIKRLDSTFTIANFEDIWESAFELNLQREGSVMEFTMVSTDHCMSQTQPRPFPCFGQEASCRPTYCPVDAPCWLMFTKPGAQEYYLTHQLLFLLLGENGGCAPDFEAHVRRYFGSLLPADADASEVTPEIMRHQCQGVLRDATIIANGGYPDILKDLFVEQGFLCGAAVNMPEFFDPEWVRAAISWQEPSGCYGFPHPSGLGVDYHSMSRQENFAETQKNTAESQGRSEDKAAVEGRIKQARPGPSARREQVLSGKCYAHYTAVALGYFAVAMRYLTE